VSRYDEAFGTDWSGLERAELLTRAYALGVGAACGEPDPEELDRLFAATETTYDRSMAELAYHEGREKGGAIRPRVADAAAVWEALVGEGTGDLAAADGVDGADGDREPDRRADAEGEGGVGSRDPPAPVTDQPLLSRSELLERSTPDDRSALRLPAFLRRD
jgi:hypothetical protein